MAKLRATKTGDGVIVLRTHMGAGHGGSSGREARRRELAAACWCPWLGKVARTTVQIVRREVGAVRLQTAEIQAAVKLLLGQDREQAAPHRVR